MSDLFTLVGEAIETWEAEAGLNLLIGDRDRLTAHVVLAASAGFGRMVDVLESQFCDLRDQMQAGTSA